MSDRGQTAHDYLIGVSIMLITLFGIFALVPGIYEPFQEPVGPEEAAIADRVADRLVQDHAVRGTQNTLNYTALEGTLHSDSDFERLRERAGMPDDYRQVNVTVMRPDGSRLGVMGDLDHESEYFLNRSVSATSIRTVRFEDNRCDPVCKVLVRVW